LPAFAYESGLIFVFIGLGGVGVCAVDPGAMVFGAGTQWWETFKKVIDVLGKLPAFGVSLIQIERFLGLRG
jgi:hypothetical protein